MRSKVFSTLADLNISGASVTKAGRSDIKQIKQELRVEAILNAQANAKTLAEALVQKIGKAIQINEYDYARDDYMYMPQADLVQLRSEAMPKNTSDSDLEFKNMKITHNVTAMFILE